MEIKAKKFLLLLLFSPIEKKGEFNIKIPGITRLMKMVFLFDKEVKNDFKKDSDIEYVELPEFIAWKYGPFSRDLLDNLEFLINNGFVESVNNSVEPFIASEIEEYNKFEYWVDDTIYQTVKEYNEEVYSLTVKGIEKTKPVWDSLTENQKNILLHFKQIMVKGPLDRILSYVYKKYEKEGYTDKSLIREKYLKW